MRQGTMRKVLTAALLSMIATAILSVAQAARAETSTAQSNSGSKKTAILSAADVVLTETNIPLRAWGRLTDIDSPQTFVARHNVAGTNGVCGLSISVSLPQALRGMLVSVNKIGRAHV